ncbi:G-protein coupled receptor Mth2 isoform X1 [Papilio machaon]|uniref:G-protein coupled receptor Mth2 isoform X1 n=1 Tax=Papilio machaon TaxID=76193 RepID=UPI001E665CA3|nr:G-protein coupled receptor Mth2 isoform X1 [Papilio machaon]
MLFPVYVCYFLVTVVAAGDFFSNGEPTVFRKCCPRQHSLVKVVTDHYKHFDCLDRLSLAQTYNISYSPLIISDERFVSVDYGLPILCDGINMIVSAVDLEAKLSTSLNICYDRLVAEVSNGTLMPYIPQTIGLTCINNETETKSESALQINHVRKCCKKGQVFSARYHVCVDSGDNDEQWIVDRLNLTDSYVYEVDIGLQCKSDEYAVELRQRDYTFSVDKNVLIATNRNDRSKTNSLMKGEWCMDQGYDMEDMVAKICTRNCATFNAFCVRKCCPEGYHYKVRRCNSLVSSCVPNVDEQNYFQPMYYLEPLRNDHFGLTDIMGIRTNLECPDGKFVLNRSDPRDNHRLTAEGLLESSISLTNDYCIEMFDRRHCPENDVISSTVLCFIAAEKIKDFRVAFVINSISSVCLALTLIVYCALPELRNLHGQTLICHVSMMLLAYSCLARVQYSPVFDKLTCKLLGYGIYFGFMAAFGWLNVMCFDIWWTFGSVRTVQPLRKSSSERRRFIWYSMYAWSIAVVLTLTMFLLDRYPISIILDANIGNGACWFGSLQNVQSDWPHYIYFVIPIGIITGTNFILWILTARHCARVKSEVHRLQAGSVGDRAKRRFRVDRAKYVLTGKLWVVMGAGWVSELLSTIVTQPPWLWTIVDLFNELQGVFIFLILVVKPKLYYLIRKRLGCSRTPIDTRLEKPDSQKKGTSSSARTSSTFLSRTISSDERANLRTYQHNNHKQS